MDAVNSTGLNALVNRLLDEAEASPSENESAAGAYATSPPTEDSPSAAALTAPVLPSDPSPLTGLLGNPALLAALPTVLENIGPLLGTLSGGTGSAPTATRPHTLDRHTALLCAVKPYLGAERQNTADTLIRLCRVWDALERSGISLTGLLGAIPQGSSTASTREGR